MMTGRLRWAGPAEVVEDVLDIEEEEEEGEGFLME